MQAMQSFDFQPRMLHGRRTMTEEDRTRLEEQDRTRLIGEIASVLCDRTMPAEARAAALTLIGWLARRMPGECASTNGVEEMVRRSNARTNARKGGSNSHGHG